VTKKVYAAFFRGQFPEIGTSVGIDVMAASARAQGVVADVFDYQDWATAVSRIQHWRGLDYKIALVGYSLGCSSATYIQTLRPVDMVICIAESTLGQNYPIDEKNTPVSILYHGQDFLSSGGSTDGFKYVTQVDVTPFTVPVFDHLAMDWASVVTKGVLSHLAQL
jgi:hypothetical protein